MRSMTLRSLSTAMPSRPRPDGASVCADDFSTVVDCAECGCELAFGESYTSRLIHNDLGFGYAVCPRCYEAEFREMGESCDL